MAVVMRAQQGQRPKPRHGAASHDAVAAGYAACAACGALRLAAGSLAAADFATAVMRGKGAAADDAAFKAIERALGVSSGTNPIAVPAKSKPRIIPFS
ncbi:MAG: hypothetical protein ACREC0_10835 [Methylocella sp.]